MALLSAFCSSDPHLDFKEECNDFEKKIEEVSKGEGIDLFIGGIGPDGHVAFNEPGSSLRCDPTSIYCLRMPSRNFCMTLPRSRTRIKTLAYETVLANQQHFIPVEWKDDAEVLCLDVPMDAIRIRCPDVSLSISLCFLRTPSRCTSNRSHLRND